MMDRVPEFGFSGTQNQSKNGFETSWTMRFFIFWPKFLAYLMNFSKFRSTLWKIKKYAKNLAKTIWREYTFFRLWHYMPKLSLFIMKTPNKSITKIVKAPSRKFNFLLWKEFQAGVILSEFLHNITVGKNPWKGVIWRSHCSVCALKTKIFFFSKKGAHRLQS
jgi:hypothetical protein